MWLWCGANGQRKAASIAIALGFLALTTAHTMGLAASSGAATTSGESAPRAASEEPVDVGSAPAVVQQPRPFGYALGDTLTQRILLGPAGQEFQPAALPPAERAGLWFARQIGRAHV